MKKDYKPVLNMDSFEVVKPKKSIVILNIIVLTVLVAFVFLYVFQKVSINNKGFEIVQYEKRLDDINKDMMKLETQITKFNSLHYLESSSTQFEKDDYQPIDPNTVSELEIDRGEVVVR